MVGVDLKPDAKFLFMVERHHTCDAAERFRECRGCTTMQDSVGLHCPFVNGHPPFQIVFANFCDLDSDMLAMVPLPRPFMYSTVTYLNRVDIAIPFLMKR